MAHSLTSLAIFQSIICKEMIRSLHVYGSVEIEREFLFQRKSRYVEKKAKPLFLSEGFRLTEISKGSIFDTWQCIFLFRSNHSLPLFPTFLCLSRNPKLEDLPNLANDLKFVSELKPRLLLKTCDHEQCSKVQHCKFDQPEPRKFVLKQDLNCFPDSEETESDECTNDQNAHLESDASKGYISKKSKRAATEHVAGLSLEDLSKYFGVPIVEASKNLNIGLTVLKKKCREFGIPRWPHRKIKSLDSLIQDLQGEAEKQLEKNKAAAMAVAKRKKKLETVKRNMVKKPFMEIDIETKRFRQDNFKKRHKASRAKRIKSVLN